MIATLSIVASVAFVASSYKLARAIARPIARAIESRISA